MKYLTIFILFISITSCLNKHEPDCGFNQNVYGEKISWKKSFPISLEISSSIPKDLKSVIYNAALSWDKKLGKKVFNISESNLPSSQKKDYKNGIYFLNNWDINKKHEQGRTSIYWEGNQIEEADILINGDNFSYYNDKYKTSKNNTDSYNFEALILHEMGHVLGLRHSENSNSVMSTHLAAFSNRISLAQEEAENLKCAYKLSSISSLKAE